jgi:dolichyl-phosphate beta-glucosyltransferase
VARTGEVTAAKRRLLPHLAVLATLGLLGVALNARAWSHGAGQMLTLSKRGDVAEQMWFLSLMPHLVFHGLSPLHTSLAYAGSGGVNLMANTSMIGPALLLSPFTALSGPVLALNVGLVLAPVLSGWAMYALLTRVTTSFAIAALGAVSFGFCPAILNHLRVGHLQLTFALVLPLAGLLALDLVRGDRSVKRTGVLAGLLIVVQYSIGAEMLAIEAVTAGMLLAVAACVLRRDLLPWLALGLKALPSALFVAVPLLAIPISYELFGPRHFSGPPWANSAEGAGLFDLVDPRHPHETLNWLPSIFGNLGPDGAPMNYLGWAMVAALVAVGITMRSDRRIRILLGSIVLLVVANFGQALMVRRGDGNIVLNWMPWRLVVHIPVLEQLTVSRLAFATSALVTVTLAIGLNRFHEVLTSRLVGHPLLAMVTCSAVVALVLVPGVVNQALPLTVSTAGTAPSWVSEFGQHPGPNERVLFLPYPSTPPGLSAPLAWQAEAKFSYEILGGYLAVPAEPGTQSAFLVKPGGEEGALLALGSDLVQPLPTDATLALVAKAITHRHPTTIAIIPTYSGRQTIGAVVTALVGKAPVVKGQVLVWRGVTGATFHHGDARRVARCVNHAASLNLNMVPRCVLRASQARENTGY